MRETAFEARAEVGHAMRRVYRNACLLYLVALLLVLGTLDLRWILGVTAGWLLALGVLRGWQWALPVGLRVAAGGRGSAVALFGLLKLPLVGLLIYGLVGTGWVHAGAFALGFALPQLAGVAVLVGARRRGQRQGTETAHGIASR